MSDSEDTDNKSVNEHNKGGSISGRQMIGSGTGSVSSNQTAISNRHRRRATSMSNSWFNGPAQAYAAAAAAANAAALLASQQQQNHQQQHQQRVEAAMSGVGANPFEFASSSNINQVGDIQNALAGIMYNSLVDSAAMQNARAQENQRSFSPYNSNIQSSEFMDQSDSLTGGSLSINRDSPAFGMSTTPDAGFGGIDNQWPPSEFQTGGFFPNPSNNPLQMHHTDTRFGIQNVMEPSQINLGPHRSTSAFLDYPQTMFPFNNGPTSLVPPIGTMPEFDDTPAGNRLIGVALNENKSSRRKSRRSLS